MVAGIRATLPIKQLGEDMPTQFQELEAVAHKLEQHHRNMQDMEFTIERGKLWMLQTRDGKRTAQAEVRIAADMVEEGLISREEAVRRVKPDQVDFFLHPQLDQSAMEGAELVATGLNVSPGAAVGAVAFDPETAEKWANDEGRKVCLLYTSDAADE